MQYKKQVATDKPGGILVTGDQKHQIRDVVSGVVGHKLTTLPGKCRLCLLIQSQKHDTSHLSAHVPHWQDQASYRHWQMNIATTSMPSPIVPLGPSSTLPAIKKRKKEKNVHSTQDLLADRGLPSRPL